MTELPQLWIRTTIGELIEPFESIDPTLEPGREFRYVDIGSIDNATQTVTKPKNFSGRDAPSRARRLVRKGDVLFSTVRTYLKNIAVVPEELDGALTSTGIAVMRPGNAIEGRFLFNWVRSEEFVSSMSRSQDGSLYPAVTDRDVNGGSIPLPPIAEQRRIVAKLDGLLSRTARARKELDHIPNLAARCKQAILLAAFQGSLTELWRRTRPDLENAIDLVKRTPEPEQSRGGREATTEVIEGVGGIAVNSPKVTLPEGWQWVSLRRIARQETGHTPSRKHPEWWNGDVPWLGIRDANLHHGRRIMDTIQTTNEEGLAHSSARLLPAGTVCLSRTASVGYVTIMGRPMATSQDFATWTCSDAILPDYLMFALMSEGDEIRRFGKGSTHTTIYFPEIRAFHVKLAPLEEQKEIVRKVRASLARIERLEKEARRASHLLDRLDENALAKAFRGELVPQDPNDEPASMLLERIRAARATKPERKRKTRSSDLPRAPRQRAAMTKSRLDQDVMHQPYLAKHLRDAGGSAKVEELFRRADLPVTDFYKQLAWEVDAGHVNDQGALLEAA